MFLHERYPDCKFILTVRDNSEVWFKSRDTVARNITTPTQAVGSWIDNVRRLGMYLKWLFSIVRHVTPAESKEKDAYCIPSGAT